MGVGNLNVSCSADINPAVGSIGGLRKSVRGLRDEVAATGPAFAQLENQINRAGSTAAEFEKKFARAKKAGGSIGGSDVDLRSSASAYDRMNAAAEKQVGLVKQLKVGMKGFKDVLQAASIISFAPHAFKMGFEFGNKLGEGFKRGWKAPLQDAMGYLDKLTDPQADYMEKKRAARAKAENEKAQKIADTNAKYDEQRAAAERASKVARIGEERVKQEEDVKEFGPERAKKLAADRWAAQLRDQRAAVAAATAAGWRAKEEERINAIQQQREAAAQKYRKAQEAAQENFKKDEQTVLDLRKRVADYWKTDRQRERDDTLASIEDPRLKQQAAYEFQRLRAADRVKEQSDARNNNPSLSLAESGSRESYIQRAAIRRQEMGEKHQKEMVSVLRQIRDNQQTGGSALPAANI